MKENVNFGMNVRFHARRYYTPKSETELLEILRVHRRGTIRAVGSKHAWSDGIQSDDALVDLRHVNHVRLDQSDGKTIVTVGAGCQIKRLLRILNQQQLTLPSVGLISEQTIAGATATATHGSGKHSLSHYLTSLRIACYDESGKRPLMRKVDASVELQAARCSLGCLGVVYEVSLPCIPQYYVREQATPATTIQQMLDLESRSPLQQFFLLPHAWTYLAQQRSVAEQSKRSGWAGLYRVYWFLTMDIGIHLLIKVMASIFKSRDLVRFFFRRVLSKFVFPQWIVVDRSDRQLVMEHELFRHLELEVFVRRSDLIAASHFLTEILRIADDAQVTLTDATQQMLREADLSEQSAAIRGCYTQHYPICFRRILPDDTLISMTSGSEEDWFSISFITYTLPREPFFLLATFLAQSMSKLFRARIHWGKWFPLEHAAIREQYPQLDAFRQVCQQFDPNGVFRNRFIQRLLDL
jgi:FAD/FMN-containing dehydrogenase